MILRPHLSTLFPYTTLFRSIRLKLVDERHRHAEVDVADVLAALEADRDAVAGSVEIVFRKRDVGRQSLPVLAAARVAHAEIGAAGALLDDGPHHRHVAAFRTERLERGVDRL